MNNLRYIILSICMCVVASCDRDADLGRGYKLYDLDGSNQVIIGAGGMLAISDVTAYAIKGRFIFVEVGSSTEQSKCSYVIVDSNKNRLLSVSPGSRSEKVVIEAVTAQRRGIVSRSCLN